MIHVSNYNFTIDLTILVILFILVVIKWNERSFKGVVIVFRVFLVRRRDHFHFHLYAYMLVCVWFSIKIFWYFGVFKKMKKQKNSLHSTPLQS